MMFASSVNIIMCDVHMHLLSVCVHRSDYVCSVFSVCIIKSCRHYILGLSVSDPNKNDCMCAVCYPCD